MGKTNLIILCLTLILTFAAPAFAQETPPLEAEGVAVVMRLNPFGQPVRSAQGRLINRGDDAYADITVTAAAYEADGDLVGEGFGVLVNACGAGLALDFALQPGQAHDFSVPLEFFTDFAAVDRVEISASGRAVPVETRALDLPAAITPVVVDQEIVDVEWRDDTTLLYATGCDRSLFTDWRWQRYDLTTGNSRFAMHPAAGLVTPLLRERLGLTDPLIFANSSLRFAPSGRRLVYQDAVNRFYTAANDGTLIRLVHTRLNNRSLQGVNWLPENRFLAYYYGAFGDPVIYFTADVEARAISPAPGQSYPSVIVPGATADARRIVLAGEFDGVTGYYLWVPGNNFFEILFEAQPPGSNFPPPIPLVDAETDLVARVIVARQVDGEARLQCFNRETGELGDLTPLPLRLANDERAKWWLSPNGTTLALGANGTHGGLWLIDLTALPCPETPPDPEAPQTAS